MTVNKYMVLMMAMATGYSVANAKIDADFEKSIVQEYLYFNVGDPNNSNLVETCLVGTLSPDSLRQLPSGELEMYDVAVVCETYDISNDKFTVYAPSISQVHGLTNFPVVARLQFSEAPDVELLKLAVANGFEIANRNFGLLSANVNEKSLFVRFFDLVFAKAFAGGGFCAQGAKAWLARSAAAKVVVRETAEIASRSERGGATTVAKKIEGTIPHVAVGESAIIAEKIALAGGGEADLIVKATQATSGHVDAVIRVNRR